MTGIMGIAGSRTLSVPLPLRDWSWTGDHPGRLDGEAAIAVEDVEEDIVPGGA
jgi:hypothetical protein